MVQNDLEYLTSEIANVRKKLNESEQQFDGLRQTIIREQEMWLSPTFKRAYVSSCVTFVIVTSILLILSVYKTPFVSYTISIESALSVGIATGMMPFIVVASLYNLKLRFLSANLHFTYSRISEYRSLIISLQEKLSRLSLKWKSTVIPLSARQAISSYMNTELKQLRE